MLCVWVINQFQSDHYSQNMARRRVSFSSSTSLLSLSLLFLISFSLITTIISSSSDFEGFDVEDDESLEDDSLPIHVTTTPLLTTTNPNPNPNPNPNTSPSSPDSSPSSDLPSDHKSSSTPSSFDLWDEDEFEGLPVQDDKTCTVSSEVEEREGSKNGTETGSGSDLEGEGKKKVKLSSFTIEIICGSFLVIFAINFFTGKRENENLALAWAAKFATKDSIFEKNFSLLGVGSGKDDDSPLLLKEGQNVFRFYASGRRFCQGLLATMELKSRHDLISRLYNMVIPCKDEITFEVFMNDDAMDHIVFAMAKKKVIKAIQKEMIDLQRFAVNLTPPSGRNWVPLDLQVISESKEVAGDLLNEVVLNQVFGEKAYKTYGKGFISMHFSDQYNGTSKKMLTMKFALPDAKHMDEMARLVALVPYYIDYIGRYKLSPQARSKTEPARQKVAQELYKELQIARNEVLQKKKADRRKQMEEAKAKLSEEALRKREAKERAQQMKKAMPKVKMTRGH